MKRILLGIIALQVMGCATGDFSKIDATYEERVQRCKDPMSEDRRIFGTEHICIADAAKVRDQSRANQYSIFNRLGSGSRVDTIYIYNLN